MIRKDQNHWTSLRRHKHLKRADRKNNGYDPHRKGGMTYVDAYGLDEWI